MLTGTCCARDHSSWEKTNHFGLKSLAPPCFYPPGVKRKVCMCVCARGSVRLCACALHLKVLFCLHMWACVCSFVWWRPGPMPHERRLTDLRTFLQCCSVAARECLNVKLHYPLSLSFLLCFLCYRVLSLDGAQPDSGLCTSVVGYRTGSRSVMTRSRVRLGASRGRSRNQASVSYWKKETDFSLDHNSSVAEREAVCWGQKTKQTLGLISALLSPGGHLRCGCNHWWQEQPELTAWSPPRLSLGVATPY